MGFHWFHFFLLCIEFALSLAVEQTHLLLRGQPGESFSLPESSSLCCGNASALLDCVVTDEIHCDLPTFHQLLKETPTFFLLLLPVSMNF